MKYNITPEEFKKAENSMDSEQKLASDLRQMEIRPSQEQLKQIILDGIDEEFGSLPKIEPELEKDRVPNETEIEYTKKILVIFNEILDTNYLDGLTPEDFSVTYMGTHEFEGREHANFFITFNYKGEDYEFLFEVGSEISRAGSKLISENSPQESIDKDVRKAMENDFLLALRKGIKEDMTNLIKYYSEEIDKSRRE